ncbi:MAG: hypothetical protein AAGF75_01905 [Cyanobacteria bacterium P01_H01_bin.130]
MKIWLPIFIAVFIVAQALQWAQGLALPLPIFVVAGVILAAVSNWDRRAGIPFKWFRQWQGVPDPDFQTPDAPPASSPTAPPTPIPPTSRPTVASPGETAPAQFQEIYPRSQSSSAATESGATGSETTGSETTGSEKVL